MIKLFVTILFAAPAFLFGQHVKTIKVTAHSIVYNNKLLFIQGGIMPDSYGYNDFDFEDSTGDEKSFRSVKVLDSTFSISVRVRYPHPFSLSYYDSEANRGYSSKIFFVDEGDVHLELEDLAKNKNIGDHLSSNTNEEYRYLQRLYEGVPAAVTDNTTGVSIKQDLLQKYIAKNPGSSAALWHVVLGYPLIRDNAEKANLLKIIALFSDGIRATKTYQALINNIEHDLQLAVGQIFPNISLSGTERLFDIANKHQFTLVDFWFSGCQPCIEQFPGYKKIYEASKRDQFQIIGISVDRKKNEAKWQKIIDQFKLNWLQYLDEGGKKTEELFIRKFPTNFLLDMDGKILKKDISVQDLQAFLNEH